MELIEERQRRATDREEDRRCIFVVMWAESVNVTRVGELD